MKVSFTFDGEILKLRLDVDDPMEKAIAQLMESYIIADVSVQHEQYGGYTDNTVKSVSIWMRRPKS